MSAHPYVFAAVVAGAPAAPAPAPWDADEAATLKLGDVIARLAPIQVTTDGLRELGIDPSGRDKRAVLYRESQFAAWQAFATPTKAAPTKPWPN